MSSCSAVALSSFTLWMVDFGLPSTRRLSRLKTRYVVAFEETTRLEVVAQHDPLGASRRELRGIVLWPPVDHLRAEREELAVKLLAKASVPRGPPILALHAGVARQEEALHA